MANKSRFVRARVPLLLVSVLSLAGVSSECAHSECEIPAHFTLKPGQAVLYETWDRVPHEWGPGEEVAIDWQSGVFLVNGFAHLPHDPPPPWKVEVLRRLYGRVPFVLDYVASAEGDSVTRWNAAAKELEQMHREIYAGGRRIYRATLDSLRSPEKAMDAAAAWIEQSEHVDSTVSHDEYMSQFSSRGERQAGINTALMVFWKGDNYGVALDLKERDSTTVGRTYMDPCPVEDVCSVVRLMRMGLSRPGTYRVEFVRGNINMFGSTGVQYSTGGARSTDSTYHYNRYIETAPNRQEGGR
jgi:hypothetical protein